MHLLVNTFGILNSTIVLFNIYIYIYMWLIYVAQWIRRQTHKQYNTGSRLVKTIKMGLNIILEVILYNCV